MRQNHRRHRVFGRFLGGRGILDDVDARIAFRNGHDAFHARFPLGERSGLVQDQCIGFGQRFDGAATLDQDAFARRRADRGGQRRRCGKPDAAGIVDDKHVQRASDVAGRHVDDPGKQDIDGHQRRGEFVRIGLNGGLLPGGVLDHVDDPRNGGLIAHGLHARCDRAFHDHGPGK